MVDVSRETSGTQNPSPPASRNGAQLAKWHNRHLSARARLWAAGAGYSDPEAQRAPKQVDVCFGFLQGGPSIREYHAIKRPPAPAPYKREDPPKVVEPDPAPFTDLAPMRDMTRDDMISFLREAKCGPKAIARATAAFYRIPFDEFTGPGRVRYLVEARSAMIWIASAIGGFSLPDIGRAIGRDHSTVLHSKRTYCKSFNDWAAVLSILAALTRRKQNERSENIEASGDHRSEREDDGYRSGTARMVDPIPE